MSSGTHVILLRLVNVIVTVVEVFLGLRFILKLLGASPTAGFVSWVYETSEPLLVPFKGMFPTPAMEESFIFEFSTLFAIFAYALAGWLLMEFIEFIADASKKEKRE